MNNRLATFLKLAVGLALVVVLFFLIDDPQQLGRQILDANPWLLALGALCYSSAVAISGLKWGVLLRASGIDVPVRRLLSYQWVAEFFNNFLPAQVGGDVMRGYAVAVDTKRRADAAASVLIDRFIGLMVFMIGAALASIAMLFWGRPSGEAFSGEQLVSMRLIALGSVGVSLLLIGIVASLLSRRLKEWAEHLLGILPLSQKTVPISHSLAEAFNVYRNQYRALFLTAIGSTLIVILTSVNIWLISQAIDPGQIRLLEVLAINPIIVFVLLIVPLIPGGLGVRQVTFAGTFVLLGLSAELGFAVGLLQQAIGYLVSLPGGYLWIRGRSVPHHLTLSSTSDSLTESPVGPPTKPQTR